MATMTHLCHPWGSDPGQRTLSLGIFPILGEWLLLGEGVKVVVVVVERKRGWGGYFCADGFEEGREAQGLGSIPSKAGALSPGHS